MAAKDDPEEQWRISLSKITNPVARRFYEQGRAFIRAHNSAYAIEPGTPECEAWAKYFQRIGWAPIVFREMMELSKAGATKSTTVPAQWPEWFEAGRLDAA